MWALLLLACVPDPEKPDDLDGDGFSELDGDCDDDDGAVFPGADERCDGRDDDCDGAVDEDAVDPTTAWVDADGDGAGVGEPVTACDATGAPVGGDCDDANGAVHPGATEVCGDGVDQDCDGSAAGCVPDGDVVLEDDAGLVLDGADVSGFGAVVGVIGDQTGDGLPDVVVSAPIRPAPAKALDTPFVWIFDASRDGRVAETQADAEIVGFASVAHLPGTALAAGDLDGDGTEDLVIGGPGDFENLYDWGAVWVLKGPVQGTRAVEPYPPEVEYVGTEDGGVFVAGTAHDHFGEVVAVVPDLDGDGIDDLAVGATEFAGSSGDAGRGAVTLIAGGPFATLGGEPMARIVGDEGYAYVGRAFVGLPDIDGDGVNELAVAAPSRHSGAGTVALFHALPGDTTIAEADLLLDGPEPAAQAGRSLAWEPRTGQLLVGAPHDVSDTDNAGVVWSVPVSDVDRGAFTLDEVGTPLLVGDPGDQLGYALSVADTDGDDREDLLATAYGGGFVWILTAEGLDWRLTGDPTSVGWSAAFVDADGDPFTDVVVTDEANRRAVVWRGRGQ